MSERWPGLLSREEAADYLGVSIETLSRMKAGGELRSVTLRGGSIIRYRRVDLDAFIDNLPFGDGDCPANAARESKRKAAKAARNKRQPQEQPA